MCKNSIWDLINSTINRRDERDVQTAFLFFLSEFLDIFTGKQDKDKERKPFFFFAV